MKCSKCGCKVGGITGFYGVKCTKCGYVYCTRCSGGGMSAGNCPRCGTKCKRI